MSHVASVSRSRPERGSRGSKFGTAVAATPEQMPVDVHRDRNRGMPKQLLHVLGRKLPPSVRAPVEAPGGEEMPEGVQAVFGPASLVYHPGCKQGGIKAREHTSVMLRPTC